VAVSDIIAQARADAVERGTRQLSLGQKLVNRPETIGRLASHAPGVANLVLGNRLIRRLGEGFAGLSADAPLPRVHGPTFRRWFKQHAQANGETVVYFPGCSGDYYDPSTAIASVTLLNRLGFRVVVPPTACCSLPMLSTGEWGAARPRAAKLVNELDAVGEERTPIVGSSTSCILTLKRKYVDYLDMADPATERISRNSKDICEFIRDSAPHQFSAGLSPLNIRVFYHPPCQLRGHGVGTPALDLMRMIPGLEIVVSKADCCGIGGTYGYNAERREITEAVAGPLVSQVEQAYVDFVVCDSETCRWHISALTNLEAVHPVDILLKATLAASSSNFCRPRSHKESGSSIR
jgi:glycerol-3-phosphate dehydrogenase subunit C